MTPDRVGWAAYLPRRGSFQLVRAAAAATAVGWVVFGQPVVLPLAVVTVATVLLSTAGALRAERARGKPFAAEELPLWLVLSDIFAVTFWVISSGASRESIAFVLFAIVGAEAAFRTGTRGIIVAFAGFALVRVAEEAVHVATFGAATEPTRLAAEVVLTGILMLFLGSVIDGYTAARRRAATLERIAASFRDVVELPDLCRKLAEGAVEAIGADYAFLVERSREGFRVVGRAGRAPAVSGDLANAGVARDVLAERRTVTIRDYQSYPTAMPAVREAGARTVIASPIEVGGEVAAIFIVGRMRPQPFELRDAETLERLADHAAIAFRNARALARSRHVEELSRQLALEGDDDRLLQRVTDVAADLLAAEFAMVAWLEPGKESVRAATGLALRHRGHPGPPERGVLARIVATRRRVVVDDYAAWSEGTPEAKAFALHSVVAEPLLVEGVPIAALVVATAQADRRFGAEDLAVAETLAAQASVAVRNAIRRAERERRLGQLARLNELAHRLSNVRDAKALYRMVYEAAAELVPTDAFYLALYDPERRSHTFVLQIDDGREWDPDAVYPLADGPTSRVVKQGVPHVSLRPEDNAITFGNEKRRSGSAIHVPMRLGDRIIGVLSCQRYVEDGYDAEDVTMLETLASHAAAAIENVQLLVQTRELYMASVRALAAAVDARDPYTRSHSARTSALSRVIAEEMGLPAEEIRRVQLGALLHDIGKIGIPDAILNKPGRFTPDERLIMNTHAALGGAILQAVEPLRELVPIVRAHHERYDGGGYPEGVSADAVPLASYIVAAADAFEVIVSKRAYKEAQSVEFAIEELRRNAGTQFHPAVVDAFLRVLERDVARGAAYLQRVGQAAHEDLESQIPGPASLVQQFSTSSQAHARQLAILQRLASEITAVLDIETLTDRLLRIVCESMAYENGFLLTLDDATGELVVRAAVGPSASYVGERLARGRGISWQVMEDGRLANVADVREQPLFYGPEVIRSSLLVPLVLGDERVGVIGVESARVDAFNAEDEQLLSTVSHQLAAAVRVAKLHQEMKTAAATDPLTQLANRRVFFDRLETEVARSRDDGTSLSVAIVDVNNLKAVNDTYGHRVGDAALARLARILADGVRPTDLVARYGGDEFAVVFPGLPLVQAERVMERLADAVTNDRAEGLAGGLPSIAWGVAALPAGAASADLLIDVADQAMYRQKATVRDSVRSA